MDQTALRVAARWEQQAARFTLPRDSYLPKEVRGTPPNVDAKGTDLAIWTYETADKLYAIGFAAKQNKPLFHFRYPSESRREQSIEQYIQGRQGTLDSKQQRLQERKDYKHSFVVGDILSTSWGYDQTNVEFYEVTEVRGAMIIVRQVASDAARSERGAEYVVAVPGKFVGAPLRIRPQLNGAKIEGHHASKWDGKPKYETALGWGH